MGRRRTFDVDEALEAALHVFWRKGYDGASLADLTAAMGVSPPSLYAAFGDKQALFSRVLERYGDEPGVETEAALDAPTAAAGIARLLHLTARRGTDTATPPGCLFVHGALVAGSSGPAARDALAALRDRTREAVRRRLERGLAEGDVPAGTDPAVVARYAMLVNDGLGVAAVGGATAAELHAAVEVALTAGPLALREDVAP